MYRFPHSEMSAGGNFTAAELEIAAIRASHAIIELSPDGTILDLNDRFLAIIGYAREDLIGRHHRILLAPEDQDGRDYALFWQALHKGEHIAAQFRRRHKDGHTVWIQGSYNPVCGPDGAIFKIIKFATDVTAHTLKSADDAGQLEAISRSQAVISFALDGTILSANAQFCSALGYEETEIVGRHHSMFLTAEERGSEAYRDFWRMLAQGHSNGGEFRRISKDGRKVWLQATYTPILDPDGRPFKIVKFATDITAAKIKSADDAGQIAAIERAQAVITFSLDGYILSANPIFCDAIGYSEADLVGRHHRLLVRDAERDAPEYKAFWRALANGEPLAGEFCRVRADGGEVWLQATYAPILDPEGQPFKVVKYARDITDQVMQRSKFNLLSLVADNTDNAVIITDRNRHIFYANAGFERMTGYALQDVIGRNPADLLRGKHTNLNTTGRIRKNVEAGEAFYDEIMYYRRDGQPYWASLTINPVYNAAGEIDRFISIQANITETKLRALEFDAKLLAIQSMTAMAEWSVDGDLLVVNDALSGRAPVTISQLLSKQECDALLCGEVLQRELLWPTGTELWLSATFSVMKDIEGKASKILMCATDSTPRKKIVAQSAQAMQDMLSAVTQAVGDIDKIATATKQLSINASIEAARAAEAGKGFAVVASEVRTLASEASRAAGNISALIRDSRTHINGLIGDDVN